VLHLCSQIELQSNEINGLMREKSIIKITSDLPILFFEKKKRLAKPSMAEKRHQALDTKAKSFRLGVVSVMMYVYPSLRQ